MGKIANEDFWSPAPPPPIGLILQKIRIDSEWPETARNNKPSANIWKNDGVGGGGDGSIICVSWTGQNMLWSADSFMFPHVEHKAGN